MKAAYNASTFVIGVLLAQLGARLVTGGWDAPQPDSPRSLAAYGAAAAAYFLWISVAVSAVVAAAQAVPVRAVYAKGFAQRLVMVLGNSAVGLLLISMSEFGPVAVAGGFVLLALLYFGYHGSLLAQQDRDQWRDLQAASGALNSVDADAVAEALARSLATLLGAEYVEVVLHESDRRATRYVGRPPFGREEALEHASSNPPSWSRQVPAEPVSVLGWTASAEQRQELGELGLQSLTVARLATAQDQVGALRIGFRGAVELSQRERQMLVTLANHAAVALQNARLFEQAAAQRTRLAGIVENTSDGIFLIDAEGVVQEWNPAMERISGKSSGDALGRPLDQVLDAWAADGLRLTAAQIHERLLGEPHFEIDVCIQPPRGTSRDVALSLAGARSVDGSYEAAVGVARDVTAAREAEIAKQDFIATVSHELRTPLTPIKGYLLMLLRPGFDPGPEAVRTYHSRMLEQAEQLERMVDDLLSASQLSHGAFSVLPEDVDVAALVDRVLRDTWEHSQRVVLTDVIPAPPAWCDRTRLAQVVSNLLSNADKFSPRDQPITVCVRPDGDGVLLAVDDNGPGIPEDAREKVFEQFKRLGDPLTRATRGTGLGLHVARRLVDAMGGRIWVETADSGGARFLVWLPAVDSVSASEPETRGLTGEVRRQSVPH